MCERWVGDGTDCNILSVPLTIAVLHSHSAGLLNRGSLRATSPLSGAGSHCLELQLEFQLTQAVCGTWLYNCLSSTCFLCCRNCTEFNPSTGQGDTPISSTRCTCFLIDGWVEGQYVTQQVVSYTVQCNNIKKKEITLKKDENKSSNHRLSGSITTD